MKDRGAGKPSANLRLLIQQIVNHLDTTRPVNFFTPYADPATGIAKKMPFGAWMMPAFRLLAKLKGLRGGPLDA